MQTPIAFYFHYFEKLTRKKENLVKKVVNDIQGGGRGRLSR